MKIHLLAIGKGMPSWVETAFIDYSRRLPKDYQLILHEVAASKRTSRNELARIKEEESQALLAAAPKTSRKIALTAEGKLFTSEDLSQKLLHFHDDAEDLALFIGGPEGLSDALLQECRECWSLSRLTFPHPLVRIILAEQIYRAVSILQNLPYHR